MPLWICAKSYPPVSTVLSAPVGCFPAPPIVCTLTKPLFNTKKTQFCPMGGGKKKYCVAIKADKTNHFPVWVVSYYVWTWGELEWGDCCWWEERVWMPGAAESSLCISEKCCYEWSHAYSALVDVMTEWGVTKWSVTVLTHNSMHLPIFTRQDSCMEHNKIKHIQAARRTCWGSPVMEQSTGAKTTVMDLHLHESCSFSSMHIQTGRLKLCHAISKWKVF